MVSFFKLAIVISVLLISFLYGSGSAVSPRYRSKVSSCNSLSMSKTLHMKVTFTSPNIPPLLGERSSTCGASFTFTTIILSIFDEVVRL